MQAVKFPRITKQATGETVPLPERFNDIFERKQKKTPLPANIAALREAVAAFAKE